MKTPNYVLKEEHKYPSAKGSMHDLKVLPIGSFVRPIEPQYVPKHVIDDERWRWFAPKVEVFAYTSQGIIVIPRNIIREV